MLMRAEGGSTPAWMAQEERGTVAVMRVVAWIALKAGRRVARLIIPPVSLYFALTSARARNASHSYLARVLGRQPRFADVWRHFHAFGSCILDRIYLLNDRLDLFDIEIHGEEIVTGILERHEGCLLLGAHIGSFEVLRAVGSRQPDLDVSMVMYEDNARKINAVLGAINPALALKIIPLGREGAMIAVRDALDAGGFAGVLADRSVSGENTATIDFLGGRAAFPCGPFRMASMLAHPVVIMCGLYKGGNRYEVHFTRLDMSQGLPAVMEAYAGRLEVLCRSAPYNWFNFFEFWQ